MLRTELKPPPEKAPLLPGQASQTYPVGFYGLSFNADDENTLDLDLGAAKVVNAEVSTFPDRVEVYQHSSPSVLITFWGNDFAYRNGKIVGKVTRSDFVTSPLTGNINDGDVTGSIRVRLFALNCRADLTNTIDANVSADVETLFRNSTGPHGLSFDSAAFTFNVTKANLERTGAANLTFTAPSRWVMSHGGTDGVRIARISGKDHLTQILDTRYMGADSQGYQKFEAYSPDGTSIFGMITTKAQMEKGVGSSGGQVMTDVGLIAFLAQGAGNYPYLLVTGIIVIAGLLYFSWIRQRSGK